VYTPVLRRIAGTQPRLVARLTSMHRHLTYALLGRPSRPGHNSTMAGGFAIFLLFIVFVVVAVIGVIAYVGGGLLWWRKTDPQGDRAEHPDTDRG